MAVNNLKKLNDSLVKMLGEESGFFGRVFTWGQRPTAYEYIGYELTEDFLPTLKAMSADQERNLADVMVYFEWHALPLKKLLEISEKENIKLYYEITWSQFMIVIMFGMLEIAVKGKRGKRLGNKLKNIKEFLSVNLPKEKKDDIVKRYYVDEIFKYKKINNFSDVVDHLWYRVRSGFIHDGGVESRGLEWHTLDGIGTKDEPITMKSNVPVQELLQITWQAILTSYGYKGSLKLPNYKRTKRTTISESTV